MLLKKSIRFINGMAKAGEKLVVLLDIDRVLGGDAAAALGSPN